MLIIARGNAIVSNWWDLIEIGDMNYDTGTVILVCSMLMFLFLPVTAFLNV